MAEGGYFNLQIRNSLFSFVLQDYNSNTSFYLQTTLPFFFIFSLTPTTRNVFFHHSIKCAFTFKGHVVLSFDSTTDLEVT